MLTKNKFKPYFAEIFTSTHNYSIEDYYKMAKKIESLAKSQKGFLGIDSARNEVGITVSYWESLEDIKNWKLNSEHLFAQKFGKQKWYSWYNVRICRVEREYDFNK